MNEITHTLRGGELLDVVDHRGEPTGQILDKKTIHEQGIRHRDVHVWLTNGQDFLQQQRTFDKTIMPGAWDISVGEHVNAGEHYIEAAARGVREELGLEIAEKQFVSIGKMATQLMLPGWKHAHNILGDNFAVVEPDLTLEDLHLQEEEVLGARWYPLERLESDMQRPDMAALHAPHPLNLYQMGIAGMRQAIAMQQ